MRRARSLRLAQLALTGAFLGAMLLLSACGGDSHLQQQASQIRSQLAQQIQQAKNIGVPNSALQPILQQQQKLNNSSAPFAWFDDAPDNTFYKNQTTSYNQLISQLQTVIGITTGQYQGQAQQDLQSFKQALSAQQAKKAGDTQFFLLRYTNDTNRLEAAQYPKDYLAISADIDSSINILGLMSTTYGQLVIFNNTISQMKQAQIDVTAMQTEYTTDLATFNQATAVNDFQTLGSLLNAQYQESVVSSTQSLPYVGAAKLQEFEDQLSLLKTYGMDASPYQTRYTKDKTSMSDATTIDQYLSVSKQIDTDMDSMHDALIQGQSKYQITELDKEATAWGKAHAFHDKYDGQNYILDSGYTMAGIGYWLQQELSWAYTPEDYQSVVNDENDAFFNLQLFEQDYSDPTPYNQTHQTDLEMMQHDPNLKHGMVLMVSMVEQAMRVYDNGKLIVAYQVTTGRVELPSLPGEWTPILREAPTVFKSSEPKNSPYWYPDTPIHYAIEYHGSGYFVHDAWWRDAYGPGTQFPHPDPTGNSSASNGSHGCVNMQEQQAAWVYSHTDWSTQIAIY